METNSSIKRYQPLFSIQDKRLNSAPLSRCHLSIHISDTYFKISCVNATTMQCLFLETYVLAYKHPRQRLEAITQLYQDHPLLATEDWVAVTLCIDNQQYTLIPKEFSQEEKLADYLNFICFVGTDPIGHYTHSSLNMTVAFAIEPWLLSWFQTTYHNAQPRIIHQASSLIQGTWNYLRDNEPNPLPKVLVFVAPDHLHITVIKKDELLYYNRFEYTSSDKLLYYMLTVMRTLQLDTNSQEVILGGHITKNSLAYKKACRYIRKLIFINASHYFRDVLSKKVTRTYLDVLSVHLCYEAL
jgi:Protein of unknown function (DUF3822)